MRMLQPTINTHAGYDNSDLALDRAIALATKASADAALSTAQAGITDALSTLTNNFIKLGYMLHGLPTFNIPS